MSHIIIPAVVVAKAAAYLKAVLEGERAEEMPLHLAIRSQLMRYKKIKRLETIIQAAKMAVAVMTTGATMAIDVKDAALLLDGLPAGLDDFPIEADH